MKKFYKNTKMSGAFSNALRVVALLCVLIGVSSSAWAGEAAFFNKSDGEGALSIRINDAWYNYGVTGHDPNVNAITFNKALELKEYYFRTKQNGTSVCGKGSQVEFYIDGSATPQVGYVEWQGQWLWNDNGYDCYQWKYSNYDVKFPTNYGEHNIWIKVKAKYGDNCSNEICLANHEADPCGSGQGYHIKYNIVTPDIYVYGYGATGSNNSEICELTSEDNVVRHKLLHTNGQSDWFMFSNQNSPNVDNFYKKVKVNAQKCTGATIGGSPSTGSGIYAFIDANQREAGYSEPVYFYYNTNGTTTPEDDECWVEASQKATYKIEFEDGTTLGCTSINKGEVCVNSIDLGDGTYNFKIYKNGVAYYYASNINNTLTNTALTAGDQFTTLNVENYGTYTFTLQESGEDFNLKVDYVKLEEPVLLTKNPELTNNNKSVILSAYLQKNLCTTSSITDYGFVICPGGKSGCIPDKNSVRIGGGGGAEINRGSDVVYQTGITEDNLLGGVTYGYRAYVVIDDVLYLSRETAYFRLDDDCVPQQCCGQKAVTFTIDASLGEDYENDCKLVYGTLQKAIDKLQDSYNNEEDFKYVTYSNNGNHSTYNLNQPVVFNVRYYDDTPEEQSSAYIYRGTKDVGGYAGEKAPKNSNLIKDINRFDAEPVNTLTIKAGDKKAKPWVHHIVIRNSKNIVLDSLAIFSDPADYDDAEDGIQTRGDNAIEIDVNDTYWKGIDIGKLEAANILIQNCMIGSDGFTGIHVSGYDGVTFKNNDFEAIFTSASSNDIDWGASAKFIACKNIKFVQNNFRGDHATLMWLQETQNVLLMNNVFWNTNNYVAGANSATPTAIRLVAQYDKDVKNVGCYYNTFYLAENEAKTSGYKYNFLQFTNSPAKDGGSASNIVDGTIAFKYNNCYSYAEHCERKDTDPFLDEESEHNLCPNNFWSEYDQDKKDSGEDVTKSAFAFGDCQDKNKFINVREQVCKTTASGPASLIVKGQAMDLGSAPTDDEINLTGLTLESSETLADRYQIGVRQGNWTYGAYQSRDAIETTTIYWVGISEDWDDRNNWEYETRQDPNDDESPLIRQRVSCVNTFSKNLKVIVEEIGSVEVSGGRKWPKIPVFDGERSNKEDNEHVNAGLGEIANPTQFAHDIELEYGAAIKGVENLGSQAHYSSATTQFIAPRSQWLLVGTVVKPFSVKGNPSSEPRYVQSGDFYKQYKPQVYMHYVEDVDAEGNTTWAKTFTELDIDLAEDKVYALNIPDQYGSAKLPLQYYSMYFNDVAAGDDKLEKEFTFNGRFADENSMRTYTGLTEGQPTLLNHTYPCNLDANEVENRTGGKVLYYDYKNGSFKSFDSANEYIQIKPQQGFVFIPESGDQLELIPEMLANGTTRTRSVEQALPVVSINLHNANQKQGNSNIIVRYDEMQDPNMQAATDAKKVFASNSYVPELYVTLNDQKLVRTTIGNASQIIPLGIRLLSAMNVRFEKIYVKRFDKVILLDAMRGIEHDLLSSSFTTEKLTAGEYEGRYFLNLVPSDDNSYVEDDDVTTEIVEEQVSTSINIFTVGYNTIRVVSTNVELQSIYVSDMLGKTIEYKASGNFKDIVLPFTQGVYVVQVIGDNATRTEKVILK